MNIKVVQKIMGHNNYATTANIYTEVMPDKMNEEIELFNSKLLALQGRPSFGIVQLS